MKHRSGELKKRCQIAKQRLKMGYFDAVSRQNADEERVAVARTQAEYSGRTREFEYVSNAYNAADEKMYKKVCDMLGSDEITLNPIGQLIERDVYDGLDPSGKQRYILELSDKFRELQERYYRENTGS